MKSFLAFILLTICLPVASRVWDFDVWFHNTTTKTLRIETMQYHSLGFNNTPPAEFIAENAIRASHHVVTILPGDSIKVTFDDSVGGYWVRWRVKGECEKWQQGGVIDLTRDSRVITLYSFGDCPDAP